MLIGRRAEAPIRTVDMPTHTYALQLYCTAFAVGGFFLALVVLFAL